MVTKLLESLSQKSYENSEHVLRMVEYADLLGKQIGFNPDQLIEL